MSLPVVADHQWSGRWLTAADVLAGLGEERDDVVRIPGTVVPGLRDHHVHLGLIDQTALSDGPLSAVDDLGWIPDAALEWQRGRPGGCTVRVAGPFLTAPGGYPSGRVWAPPRAVVPVGSVEEGYATVAALAAAGVDLIKVALHTGMPLLEDRVLAALVAAAHEHGLPVVVHAEGDRQAVRAAAAGAEFLAHTPWTERLGDEVLERLAATITWITTLAMHSGDQDASAVALDNLARFVAVGGRIRYGTDMGNGPSPVGLNLAELEALVRAGLEQSTIMRALCRADPTPGVLTWTPLEPPEPVIDLPRWCATLRRCPVEAVGGLS